MLRSVNSNISKPSSSRLTMALGLLLVAPGNLSAQDTSNNRLGPSSLTGNSIEIRGAPGRPAVFTAMGLGAELMRSRATLSLAEADRLLSLTNVTVAHYEVSGNTAIDALYSARSRGYFDTNPSGSDLSHRPAGHTSWRVEWNLPKDDQGKPRLEKLTLSWGAMVLLPKWSGPNSNAPVVVNIPHEMQQWTNFYDNLRRHEAHHVQGVYSNVMGFVAEHRANLLTGTNLTTAVVGQQLQDMLRRIKANDSSIDGNYPH
jgi:predicted secreted Zn-dependent protease